MQEALLDSDPEIINLKSLTARFLGNTDLLNRVLSTFAETLDADLKSMEQAVGTHDAESAAFLAHRIKGMAASIEARVLWKTASIAENCAKSKALDQLAVTLTQLHCDRESLADVLRWETIAAGE
jgi:HPt (histidine-containing phosphotransfer) domain-containing protein